MNTCHPGRNLPLIAAVLLTASSLSFAQTAAEKSPANSAADSAAPKAEAVAPTTSPAVPTTEEVMVLSPFQVSTDRDIGFVAASSLAGGKMATDLKDTPLAYSVLTKEFLETLNITDTEKAMDWAVNSSQYRDDGADRIYNYDGGIRTQVRGVKPKVLRNFFELGRFDDTYNQDRIDYARGTNALLIGNGGLGGALILLTKQAEFGKNFTTASLNLTNHGGKRAVLDVNQQLGDTLAIRGNILWQDSDSWRKRIFDRRKGYYGTVSYRPFAKTQIRVDYEKFRQDELAALTHMNDYVSGWDGITTFTAPTLPAAVTGASAKGVEVMGSSTVEYRMITPGVSGSTVMNLANTWRSMGGAQTTLTPVNGVMPNNTSSLGAAGSYMIDIQNEPINRFTIATANAHFVVPGREDILAPDTPTFKQYVDNVSAFVDQQVGENIFLQGSYSHTETGRRTNLLTGRLSNLNIDLNRNLPNGQVNPHFLEAFSEAARDDRGWGEDRFDEFRLAAVYTKDNTRWGSFRVNGIVGHTTRETDNRTYTTVMVRNASIRERPFLDTFGYRYYLNDTAQYFPTPKQVSYVNPVAGTTTTYDTQELIDLNYADANNRSAKRTFDYFQAAGFAKLFKDRVILLAGARRDQFKLESLNMLANPRTSYPANWDGKTYYTNPSAPANYFSLTSSQQALYNPPDINQKVNTITYGTVIHATKWMSGFYNYAETYDTSRSVQELSGLLVSPLLSDGWDAGVRFNLLNDRINASFGTYGTTQNHAVIGSVGFLQSMLEANAYGNTDTTSAGRNTRGLDQLPLQYYDYQDSKAKGYEIEVVANITKNWRLTYNLAYPETKSTNRYSDTWAYLNARENTLRQIVLDTGAVIGADGQARVDPTVIINGSLIDLTKTPDINTAVSAWNSMQTFKTNYNPALSVVNSNYKFTTNLYTDYRFSDTVLKGLRVGAGVQYRSKLQIGNRASDTIPNPANPLVAIDDPSVDGNTPVYMRPWYVFTATASYPIKLKHGRSIDLFLNVSNLLDEDQPIYFGASLRPRGGNILDPSRVTGGGPLYYLEPRTVSLTAKLTF